MKRPLLPVLCFFATLTAGCGPDAMHEFLGDKPGPSLVPARTLEKDKDPPPAAPATRVSYAPASGDASLRVDFVGRKILKANTHIGLEPLFITIGSPDPEVFHRSRSELYITEGLQKKCVTESQLAAVLCLELGKMVAEREALAGARTRNPERRPPMDVPLGNAGQFNTPDQVHMAELAKFERERPPARVVVAPPDPKVLARLYLKNASYPETELDAVAPLLKEARDNFGLEKQIKSGPAMQVWGPKP